MISPTIDSELRFYATYWFSYGLLLVWIVRGLTQRIQLVPLVMALFFAGGVGRVLSWIVVGAPHPVFILPLVIELIYPVIVAVLYRRLSKTTA
jgi:hypothetical protein